LYKFNYDLKDVGLTCNFTVLQGSDPELGVRMFSKTV
jgi:hypothetical protein